MTHQDNNQIEFIYRWKRNTRSPWDTDAIRVAWYFDDEKNYIYEHKDELFRCNGFSISKGLSEKLPEDLQNRYFEADERGLLFILFGSQIMTFILGDKTITEREFVNLFGVPKTVYFSEFAIENWENLIDL